MSHVSVQVLGAGGEVGRSCFVVTIDDVSILVDTGVHLASSCSDRVPSIPMEARISAVVITHYHLDHIGALPYLMEVIGSKSLHDCPIYMTVPTSLLAPPILIDYCRSGPNSDLYTPNHVVRCFQRVKTLSLNSETFPIENKQFSITAFHSGHVLGGVGLLINHKGRTVVYTGDFSVVEDSLLRPINIPQLALPVGGTDLVISESTHATRTADRSISVSERELTDRVAAALKRNGKVLIPIFAVGRTQEIASIIRSHLGSEPRLYTTSASGKKASVITQSIARSWSAKTDDIEVGDLDVKLLTDLTNLPSEPCVIFSSPAMLEGGVSLELFLRLCTNTRNLILLTGYCSPGSVGNSVILFASKRIPNRHIIVHGESINVNCECAYIPFSNHSDSPGIESVVRRFVPRNVILVHGERAKMESFTNKIKKTWAVDVNISIPENGNMVEYAQNDERKHRTDRSCPVTIRRKIPVGDPDLDKIMGVLSNSNEHIGITAVNDQIIVLAGSISVRVSLIVSESAVLVEYVSDSRMQSAEWVIYSQLFLWVKNALSSMREDNFSISECS